MIPHDLLAKSTVYDYHSKWIKDGTWHKALYALNRAARKKKACEPTPSLLIVDSQSVKTAHGGEDIGIDGNKKVKGRKRHILVDKLGLLWTCLLTAANKADGKALLEMMDSVQDLPRLETILGDGGYAIANLPKTFTAETLR